MHNQSTNDCPSLVKAGKRGEGAGRRSRLLGFHAVGFLAAGLLLAAGSLGLGQEAQDPLLDSMIQKGMITQEEARKVQAEADAYRSNAVQHAMSSMDTKWKISNGIKRLELYGDVRVRYEDRDAEDTHGADIKLQRERYAIRLGLRGDAFDNYYFGLRLETGANGARPG